MNIAVQDINKALSNSYGTYIWPVGGGQISLTSLTISPAVLNLNIAIQHINKALPEVYGFYIRPEGS